MTTRLGKHQLSLLATMASPFSLLVVGDKVAGSLEKRGLLETRAPKHVSDEVKGKHPKGFLSITPAGLRAVAAALEAGELEQFYDPKFQRDRVRIYISGEATK